MIFTVILKVWLVVLQRLWLSAYFITVFMFFFQRNSPQTSLIYLLFNLCNRKKLLKNKLKFELIVYLYQEIHTNFFIYISQIFLQFLSLLIRISTLIHFIDLQLFSRFQPFIIQRYQIKQQNTKILKYQNTKILKYQNTKILKQQYNSIILITKNKKPSKNINMNPNLLSTQMISNQTQKENKQKDKFISLQSQSLFESNRIAIISAIKMRKNAIQKTNALKSHGSNYKYQIMSNQKNKDIYGDNALRSLNNINTLSYQSRSRFLTLKKQNTQNNSEFFDQKYQKVRVKTQNSLSLTFEKIKDENKTPLYNEQIQNSYIMNKIRSNFSSIGKIKKNKTGKNSTTSLIRKQQIYETFHLDYKTPNSQLYLGRHKKLALQNKVIDQLLRMKILNSSKSINIQYNKSDYASMNNSKTSFIMHHTAADEKNIGVTDKKLMQFQEKYKDMVQEYDLKKKLLNQERGDYQYKNQILSQNRQNINFTKIGKIKQNIKETQQSSKQEIKNQTITNIFQESSNIIVSNKKKSAFNSKQENLQQKFRLYQQKCNKYQQLSKKTVQLKQKNIENIERVSKSQNKFSNKNDSYSRVITVKFKQNLQNDKKRQDCRNIRSKTQIKNKFSLNTDTNICKDFFNLISKQIQKDQEVRVLKHHKKYYEGENIKINEQIVEIIRKENFLISQEQLMDHIQLSNEQYDPFFIIRQIQLHQLVNQLVSAIKISQQFWRKFIFQSLTSEETSQIIKILKLDNQHQNSMDLKEFTREIGYNLNLNKIIRNRDLYRIYRRILLNQKTQNVIIKKKELQISNLNTIDKNAFIRTFTNKLECNDNKS